MKKVRAWWLAFLLVGIVGFTGILFSSGTSAHAAEMSDLDRLSPFNVRSLWLMRQVRAIIEAYQVDAETRPVAEEDLVHGAIKGMVEAWKDPYTRFVAPQQLKDEEIEMEARYGGLGMYIGERDGQVLVIAPMEDSPAERAGLKTKDQIVKVNSEVVIGWDSQRIVQLLRGEPGTKVTVWVRREGEAELLEFELTREIIKLTSVRSEMLSDDVTGDSADDNPKIGYVRLTQFTQKTYEETRDAVRKLMKQGAQAMILDLRNNGGGLLDASVKIVSMFVKGGLVVETRGRAERANEKYYADSALFLTDMPLKVLINGGSASASEIVAGALSDKKRAELIGEKSFGKGSVQTLFPLTDGSGLYVTIARYYTPSGKVIDHVGLTPAIEVTGELDRDTTKDAQLQRAISELKKMLPSGAKNSKKR